MGGAGRKTKLGCEWTRRAYVAMLRMSFTAFASTARTPYISTSVSDANPTVVASLMLGVTLFNSKTEHLRAHMPAWRDVSDESYLDLLTDVLMRGVRADAANATSDMRNGAT